MFTVALLIIAKTGKHSPLTSEWINKLWHISLKPGIISHPSDKASIKDFNNTKCWQDYG